jgi:hypothetical protein
MAALPPLALRSSEMGEAVQQRFHMAMTLRSTKGGQVGIRRRLETIGDLDREAPAERFHLRRAPLAAPFKTPTLTMAVL